MNLSKRKEQQEEEDLKKSIIVDLTIIEAKNIGIILSVSEQYDKHFGTIQKQSIAH